MFEAFFISLALNLVSAALARAAAPKPQKPKAGNIEIPKATEGEAITYVFGTVLIKDPVVHWAGGQRAIAVRKKGGKK